MIYGQLFSEIASRENSFVQILAGPKQMTRNFNFSSVYLQSVIPSLYNSSSLLAAGPAIHALGPGCLDMHGAFTGNDLSFSSVYLTDISLIVYCSLSLRRVRAVLSYCYT